MKRALMVVFVMLSMISVGFCVIKESLEIREVGEKGIIRVAREVSTIEESSSVVRTGKRTGNLDITVYSLDDRGEQRDRTKFYGLITEKTVVTVMNRTNISKENLDLLDGQLVVAYGKILTTYKYASEVGMLYPDWEEVVLYVLPEEEK
jgi:hypothetical protein